MQKPPAPPSKKPVIGITSDNVDNSHKYLMNFAYCDAVSSAGGIPLILPFKSFVDDVPQVVDLLDGIIFSGGNDLDPSAWGEPVHPKATPIHPEREKYERALMAEVERRRLPTLGICLGSQLMNVHRGGSLHQFFLDRDLSPAIEHRKLEGKDGRHGVAVTPGSVLAGAVGGPDIVSNSAHKQTMNKIGRGLKVVATAPDGIIEALEDPTFPLWLGVQWHPERVFSEPPHHKLFELLVEKAAVQKASGTR